MYNGLSAGNQDLGILPPPVVAGHWGWGGSAAPPSVLNTLDPQRLHVEIKGRRRRHIR